MSIDTRKAIFTLLERVRMYELSGHDVQGEIRNGYFLYYITVNGQRQYFDGLFTVDEYAAYQREMIGNHTMHAAVGTLVQRGAYYAC